MELKSEGVLILEKVSWNCESCMSCALHQCGTIPGNKSFTSTNFLCPTQERHYEQTSRKQSIFDIFWEKFNAPMKTCSRANSLQGSQVVVRNGGHLGSHFENCETSSKQPWGIPIGCYNVYM